MRGLPVRFKSIMQRAWHQVRRFTARWTDTSFPGWFPVGPFTRFYLVALVLGIPGAGVLYALVETAGIHYLLAGAINCLAMTVLSYLLNSVFTFGCFVGTRGFLRFLTSRLGSIMVGMSLYMVLTTVFGMWYLGASLFSAALGNALNFAISYFWVWRHRTHRAKLLTATVQGQP